MHIYCGMKRQPAGEMRKNNTAGKQGGVCAALFLINCERGMGERMWAKIRGRSRVSSSSGSTRSRTRRFSKKKCIERQEEERVPNVMSANEFHCLSNPLMPHEKVVLFFLLEFRVSLKRFALMCPKREQDVWWLSPTHFSFTEPAKWFNFGAGKREEQSKTREERQREKFNIFSPSY